MDNLKVIAHIHTDFPEKFGIPRQSGLACNLAGRIVFEPEYRNIHALKGIEEFSHLWILWEFEGVDRGEWSPTVRPPRLGGNETRGVFATRSPFRPNPIGLSCVKFLKVEETSDGPVIYVSGIDMRDNTPIFDIKPYLSYVDAHFDASNGFAEETKDARLQVEFPPELLELLPAEKRKGCIEALAQDPRPQYQDDPQRIYGMAFAGKNIRFRVEENRLLVLDVT